MKLKWSMKIKEEVIKQLEAHFFGVTDYPEWLANIILVRQKIEMRECLLITDI